MGNETPLAQLPVPSITGNPGWDSAIGSVLIAASAGATTAIVTWLGAHHLTDPNLNLLIGAAVFTTLSTFAVAAWRWIKGMQVGKVVADAKLSGVQAGMIAQSTIAGTGDGAATAANVTHDSAQKIIEKFAPPLPTPAVVAATVSSTPPALGPLGL